MINKSKLLNFISKYNFDSTAVGKVDNSVILDSEGNSITTKFKSEDKSLLGLVKISNIEFPPGEFGIYETSKFQALVKLMSDEFEITATPGMLGIKDSIYDATFMLASLDIIKRPDPLKHIPEADISFNATPEFIDTYLKAWGAIGGEVVAFKYSKSNGMELILNYNTHNSHTVSLKINAVPENPFTMMLFNSLMLRDILLNNRDVVQGEIQISTQGLMVLKFQTEDIKSIYYLVSKE